MNLPLKELNQLFTKSIKGCPDSFGKLSKEITPYIRKVISSKGIKDDNDIQDIIQEIFILILKKGNTFNAEKSSILSWISVVSERKCIDFYRKNSRYKKLLNSFENYKITNIQDNYRSIADLDRIQYLNESLQVLTDTDMEFIHLHYYRGATFDQCSKILNKPMGTIKSRVNGMLNRLRKPIFMKEEALK